MIAARAFEHLLPHPGVDVDLHLEIEARIAEADHAAGVDRAVRDARDDPLDPGRDLRAHLGRGVVGDADREDHAALVQPREVVQLLVEDVGVGDDHLLAGGTARMRVVFSPIASTVPVV